MTALSDATDFTERVSITTGLVPFKNRQRHGAVPGVDRHGCNGVTSDCRSDGSGGGAYFKRLDNHVVRSGVCALLCALRR